jgi:hypothetical protein
MTGTRDAGPKGSRRRARPRVEIEIPVNLERILLAASRDGALRAALVEDPLGTASREGCELTGSERAMLAAMTPSALAAMLERIAPGRPRSRFASKVAAAVAGTLLVTTACTGDGGGGDIADSAVDAGIDPEYDWPVDTMVEDTSDTGGEDIPPEVEDPTDEDAWTDALDATGEQDVEDDVDDAADAEE